MLLIVVSCLSAYGQATGGIGAVLMMDTLKDGATLPRIKSLVPNSPAVAAQLPVGFYILSVNDFKCRDKSLEEVVGHIRGEAGTTAVLLLADNPDGKKPKSYSIIRAAIQTQATNAPMPDPVSIFNQECENEVKALRKQGFAIIKTFNSDCGDYFFNFDSDNSLFRARVISMEVKQPGLVYKKGFEASAVLFDNSDEATKTPLKTTTTRDQENYVVAELEGNMTLKRNSIGVVSVQLHPLADIKRCAAMYVIVYK